MADEMLTTSEIAAKLRKNADTIRRWVRQGYFQNYIELDKDYLIPAESYQAFLEKRRGKTGPRPVTPRKKKPAKAAEAAAPKRKARKPKAEAAPKRKAARKP